MMRRGDVFELEIDGIGAAAEGVGRQEGMAVFVPGTLPGERVRVRAVQVKKSFARARLLAVLQPSAGRVQPCCPHYASCGGCMLQHAEDALQLVLKRDIVSQALSRIGGSRCVVAPVLPAEKRLQYRNRAVLHLPAGGGAGFGFFHAGSRCVQPLTDCLLLRPVLRGFLPRLYVWLGKTGKHIPGLRALALRCNSAEEGMLCTLILDQPHPAARDAAVELLTAEPRLCGVWSCSGKPVYGAYGAKWQLLAGKGQLMDMIDGIPLSLSPASFTQVHPEQTVRLYETVRRFAALSGRETVFDLYSGIGCIALSMAGKAKEVIGVENYAPAAADAARNAALAGIGNCRFLAEDAAQALPRLAAENIQPDVVVLDPPRAGCSEAVIDSVVQAVPQRIVYVSCAPATLARDVRRFAAAGYLPQQIQPLDMFPQTSHVETVVLLSKGEVDSKKIRVEFSLEDMDMSEFQDGATYPQIKEYVLENTGLKVSNLYISQIKRKCGIEVGKNYNLPKSEDSRQPQCPPEKEKAIREAFKYFGMI